MAATLFPAARIDPPRRRAGKGSGESPLDAAKRETVEEVGLNVAAIAVLGERIHPITDRHMIYVQCQASEPNSATLVDSEELAEFAWCTWAEVQERIPAGIFTPVANYLSSLPG